MSGLFDLFKRGLEKTKTALLRTLSGVFSDAKTWDATTYANLEKALIATDLGASISKELVAEIKDAYDRGKISTEEDVIVVAKNRILSILAEGAPAVLNRPSEGPTVILMVGVNGSGKTTSTAKLAHYYMGQGASVILGAGDTFRAAGIEQLKIWGERLECPVVAGKHGGDAASVAFDTVRSARQRGCDFAIIDTAGRQHTRKDLMDELAKVKRVISKELPDAPHNIWLTVDASTGSNALTQAREFGKLFPITGLILTKLDGTGKGGIVVAIRRELGYPVHFVGLGEQMDDLQPFDAQSYVDALFS
ncbi:MAG: signal recognition particle-docking protein FtsY [Victivallales bacterium]|nr:signal recognition particle-docking protein FtsY [Victivallales bacterium]